MRAILYIPILSILILFSGLLSSCTKKGNQPDGRSTHGSKSRVGSGFHWEPFKRRTVRTTAYSHKENEPGAEGRKSAAGNTLRYGRIRSAAADWSRYPLGTRFKIVGKPHIYEIDDYGSALVDTNTIDIFKPSLRLMREWGTRHVEIQIVKWGSFEASYGILKKRTKYSQVRRMYHSIQPQLKRERARGQGW